MAKVKVLMISCDKCGFEEQNTKLFRRVTVTEVLPLEATTKARPKVISERDLCESCIGLPSVNREGDNA